MNQLRLNNIPNPCHGCLDRETLCHSDCDFYKQYGKEVESASTAKKHLHSDNYNYFANNKPKRKTNIISGGRK